MSAGVEHLAPDVTLISECCDEASLRQELGLLMPKCTMAWVGRDPSCRLAVLGFGPWRVELDEDARRRPLGRPARPALREPSRPRAAGGFVGCRRVVDPLVVEVCGESGIAVAVAEVTEGPS